MIPNLMYYKGYTGSFDYSFADKCFFGKIDGIKDLVSFESKRVDTLKTEFEAAVDDYLITCEEVEKEPDQPTEQIKSSAELAAELFIKSHPFVQSRMV